MYHTPQVHPAAGRDRTEPEPRDTWNGPKADRRTAEAHALISASSSYSATKAVGVMGPMRYERARETSYVMTSKRCTAKQRCDVVGPCGAWLRCAWALS